MNGKHITGIDGPKTQKNANADVLKPGSKDAVKGAPKSGVKQGMKNTAVSC